MSDPDLMPALLENFALEWEADIRFNKMSDGNDPGPGVKILPREQCSRETLERRIAFVREVGETVERLRQELAESREREALHRADATCAWKEAEALRHELGLAQEDLATFRSERSYVIGCNTGWDEAIEQAGELAAGYDCRLAEHSGPVERTYYEAGVVDATVGIAAAIRKLGGKTE